MKRAKFSNSASSASGRSGFTGTGRLEDHLIAFRQFALRKRSEKRERRRTILPFQALGRPLESRETFGPQSGKYWFLIYKTNTHFLEKDIILD